MKREKLDKEKNDLSFSDLLCLIRMCDYFENERLKSILLYYFLNGGSIVLPRK